MNLPNLKLHPHLIPCVLASALLFWALGSHPYSYYQILRWVTAGVGIYCAWSFWAHRIQAIRWVFIGVVVLFNPLAPIHLSRPTWRLLDLAAGVVFLVSAAIRSPRK